MFRHVVVFRFKPGTSDQQVDEIERGVANLAKRPNGGRPISRT
jgi:hypothetical protein